MEQLDRGFVGNVVPGLSPPCMPPLGTPPPARPYLYSEYSGCSVMLLALGKDCINCNVFLAFPRHCFVCLVQNENMERKKKSLSSLFIDTQSRRCLFKRWPPKLLLYLWTVFPHHHFHCLNSSFVSNQKRIWNRIILLHCVISGVTFLKDFLT